MTDNDIIEIDSHTDADDDDDNNGIGTKIAVVLIDQLSPTKQKGIILVHEEMMVVPKQRIKSNIVPRQFLKEK